VLAFTKPFGPMDVPALADAVARHGTAHPSAALALTLVKNLDVHVYDDPCNQTTEGSEAWPLHLDLLGKRYVAHLRTLLT